MNKAYKYTLTANEHKEITFDVGVNRIAISNANGTDGDITIVTSEITRTDSGDICSFVDGADAPFADFKANIEAVQSGSGDPSPTNVRTITGWTGANVSRTGKNLFDKNNTTVSEGLITADGSIATLAGYIHIDNYIKVKASANYILSGSIIGSGAYNSVAFYDENKAFISRYVPSTPGANAAFTTPNDCRYIRFNAINSVYNANSIQLEEGTTATRYEAFGTTYNIDWQSTAGTVYGGTLDVKTGELTVTHANIASYDGETINEPWISSIDKYVAGATPTTGAQVVYPLTTPVTYQLTPTEIRSLLGLNIVWADCGSVDIKYFVQSTQPLFDYINDEDDKCVYIDCSQSGADTYSITSAITKAEFVSLLSKNKNVKLRLDTGGSGYVIFDLSYIYDGNYADFTYNHTSNVLNINSFQSLTLRMDLSGDTLSLSRLAIITIGDGTYEFVIGLNNQLIKHGWSWSTQGYDLRDADELLFMITPGVNVASDSDTIYGELQRSALDPKRALFCKGIKNMLPDVQEIESPFWFNDIVVVGNKTVHTETNDIIMKIRVWANYYNTSHPSLADVNFYADCDCNDGTANLWGMCNIFVFKKKRS